MQTKVSSNGEGPADVYVDLYYAYDQELPTLQEVS